MDNIHLIKRKPDPHQFFYEGQEFKNPSFGKERGRLLFQNKINQSINQSIN